MHSHDQKAAAIAALRSGLLHVNVSIPQQVFPDELLNALKAPSATLATGDRRIAGALRAFISETDETLLALLAQGGDVTWRDLKEAALLILRPGDEKLDWIIERARFAPRD